jgi:RimJ/RimL family protein N-acetyltransferase
VLIDKISVNDAEDVFHILQHTEIYEFITTGGPPESIEKLKNDYRAMEKGVTPDGKYKVHKWIVRDDSRHALGTIALYPFPCNRADFAYVFTPSSWGKGYAYEACSKILSDFSSNELSIFATVHPDNVRSIRLLTRLGFIQINPNEYDHDIYHSGDLVYRKDNLMLQSIANIKSAQQSNAPDALTRAGDCWR